MKNVNLNNVIFDSHTEIMNAVANELEKNDDVISANYDGECITVEYINNENIEWYCDTINYNQDKEGSIKSVDIDC